MSIRDNVCYGPRLAGVRDHGRLDELVESSLMGLDSHGVVRFIEYVQRVTEGKTKPGAPIRIVKETPNTALVDCGFNFGAVAGARMVEIACANIRDFASDRHRSVDDTPFGGGPGMVLAAPPVFAAVEHVEGLAPRSPRRILLTPQGRRFDQQLARDLSGSDRLILLCGHYEGFDERVRIGLPVEEVSIGDYVLSGGEIAAMVIIDAVVRLRPGVLGDEASATEESFSNGLLDYPQYTRPPEFERMRVPEVLLRGNHAEIRNWRKRQAAERTRRRRSDLFEGSDAEQKNG
jgi:tRNA (guanine37-N1)-methyltransferase